MDGRPGARRLRGTRSRAPRIAPAGSHPARHRDAAHGRLRVPRDDPRAEGLRHPADRHADLTRRREASREGGGARRHRLSREAVPGGRARRACRAAHPDKPAGLQKGGLLIRVAIADDSPFTCKLLAGYFEETGDCEVVGFAHDAPTTIDLVRTAAPDVLTLDLQMPGGDGLDLLREVGSAAPVPVVVISGISRRAAATTLRALELAAGDFVLNYTAGATVGAPPLKREIVTKVKAAAGAHVGAARARQVNAPAEPATRPFLRATARIPATQNGGIIVIGSSTGGPTALGELLAELPHDFATCCLLLVSTPGLRMSLRPLLLRSRKPAALASTRKKRTFGWRFVTVVLRRRPSASVARSSSWRCGPAKPSRYQKRSPSRSRSNWSP